MKTLITGATGLTGGLLLQKIATLHPGSEISCLVRPSSNRDFINSLNLKLTYYQGDSANPNTWDTVLSQATFTTIIHLVQLRQIPTLLDSLNKFQQTPRLIIIGTTGVYSQYNQYSAEYKEAEKVLSQYGGSYCLLRPTMIYGSPKDKNLHKLIKFCHRYQFFPVFGKGNNLLQPVHTEDLAQALLDVWQSPHIQGAYDLSGETIITFRDLLKLLSKLMGKPVYQLSLPFSMGITLATLLEKTLGRRSPVRREQILRLQEDKAYSYAAATRDFGFTPRSLETGLREEIALMRAQGII